MIFDSLVIGAGPAGVTAALYLARFGVSVALVERQSLGGLVLSTAEIENYPGFPKGVKGYEFADALEEHIAPYETIQRFSGEVQTLDVSGTVKRALIDGEPVEAKTVIIASGVSYKKLGLPLEERFIGRGISFCALCDGQFYRGKEIAVIGGGNSALEEALYLAKIVSKLHLVHRRNEFRAAQHYQERIRKQPNISLELSQTIAAVHGGEYLESLTLQHTGTGATKELAVDGLFVFIGFEPISAFMPSEIRIDSRGFVETDTEMRASVPGVFAVGDIRSKLCRQVVTAVGDGATAANSAYLYLEQQHV